MTFLIIFLVVLSVILLAAFWMVRVSELEMENRMTKEYMQSLQVLYDAIQERIEATRRYRHDLAKHIQTLEELLSRQGARDGKMQSYIDDLSGRYDLLRQKEYCTDEIVNSILSVKKQQCEQKQIPLDIHVEEAYYADVQEMEMVGLLYNLLDNAEEANERIDDPKERGITFSMGREEDAIWIEIENKICPGEVVDFETKKKEKDKHGIGRKIIDSMVRKYHGNIWSQIDEEKHVFKERIVLGGETA